MRIERMTKDMKEKLTTITGLKKEISNLRERVKEVSDE